MTNRSAPADRESMPGKIKGPIWSRFLLFAISSIAASKSALLDFSPTGNGAPDKPAETR
jgi:hypothetical protein